MSAPHNRELLVDVTDQRPVHFMGVAGAGMSALAELLCARRVPVTGCDLNGDSAAVLSAFGVEFASGHDPAHVTGARAVVVTAAVPRDHPELERAREAGVPIIRRADALGAVLDVAQTVIAVAGTHGKTTTTALTAEALAAAGADPTALTGGRVASWNSHLKRGGDEVMVVEADEYDRSFLSISPTVAIVTNVDADHLDIYADLSDIKRTFEEFIGPARIVVCCADNDSASTLRMPNTAEIVRYGIEASDARLRASSVAPHSNGTRFTVEYDGTRLGEVLLSVPGRHNVLNSLAAIGCGLALGLRLDEMRAGIESFTGVDRRFQRVATVRGISIVDDYAHHPAEIAATLEAARATAPGLRIVVAFQPHLFSRTRDFAAEFAQALAPADAVFLTDIYAAREAPIAGVTSDLIARELTRLGSGAAWTGPRSDVTAAIAGHVRPGDLVLTLGAGDITRAAYELRDMLSLEGGSERR